MIETSIKCKILKDNLIIKELESTEDYPKIIIGIIPFKIFLNDEFLICDKILLKKILKTLNLYDLDLFSNYLRKSSEKVKKVILDDFSNKLPYFYFDEKVLKEGYLNLENNLEDYSFNISFYFTSIEEVNKCNIWIEDFIEDILN